MGMEGPHFNVMVYSEMLRKWGQVPIRREGLPVKEEHSELWMPFTNEGSLQISKVATMENKLE
jgi:hypothetical protein